MLVHTHQHTYIHFVCILICGKQTHIHSSTDYCRHASMHTYTHRHSEADSGTRSDKTVPTIRPNTQQAKERAARVVVVAAVEEVER